MLVATLMGAAVFYLAYVRPWKAGVDTLGDDEGDGGQAVGADPHGATGSIGAEPAVVE